MDPCILTRTYIDANRLNCIDGFVFFAGPWLTTANTRIQVDSAAAVLYRLYFPNLEIQNYDPESNILIIKNVGSKVAEGIELSVRHDWITDSFQLPSLAFNETTTVALPGIKYFFAKAQCRYEKDFSRNYWTVSEPAKHLSVSCLPIQPIAASRLKFSRVNRLI